MTEGFDRYSRVAALRPVSRPQGPTALPAGSAGRLAGIVGGEVCATQHGHHLIVRRRLQETPARAFGPRALRLLLPGIDPAEGNLQRWIFLDTETTGLAGGTGTYAFLVGLAWWEEAELVVEQLFMQDHSQEASVLTALAGRLDGRRVMVTFNGKSFDCPLLETRFRMTRLGTFPGPPFHLDLLHPARILWRQRLRSVALSELERDVLALDRGPDVPSASIPGRYFDFLRGGPAEPLAEVFQHNVMDLRGLAALAVHVASMLEVGDKGMTDSADLFGLARFLKLRGERDLAEPGFERALAQGLPGTAERTARRELALLSRSRRDFESASTHWACLLGESRDGLQAYEQLAIYHEHHAGNLHEALTVTREALVRLQSAHQSGQITHHQHRHLHASFRHRLSRLTRKLGVR